jgi:hypothetical protein
MNSACPIHLKGILFSLVLNEGNAKWRENISNFDLSQCSLPPLVSLLTIINEPNEKELSVSTNYTIQFFIRTDVDCSISDITLCAYVPHVLTLAIGILAYWIQLRNKQPIKMTARYKAWTVFVRSNAGFESYSKHGCLCAFILCVGSGLAMGWSPVQGVLPTVYKIKTLKKRIRSNKGTVEP